MRFDIVTVFPEVFKSYLNTSILKRAQKEGLISIRIRGLRKWGQGRHKQLDDKPYGGGAGMVLQALPILRAAESLKPDVKGEKIKTIILSAKGRQFNQRLAYNWTRRYDNIVLISGRYEGIDERVRQVLKAEEISIGPYITTDGDVAAMIVISALTRLIPGVINWESLEDESFFNRLIEKEKNRKDLEYPHYTRPEILEWKNKKYKVPKVLLSGNHKKIEGWRKSKRVKKSRQYNFNTPR